MQRITLSWSSTAEIMITGMSRSAASPFISREHLEPVHAWHDDVEQDEVDVAGSHRGQGLDAVLRGCDAMALALESRAAGWRG